MKKLTNKKGFTLIEMLVVIAIIAVLVAIIIPTVTSATNKAACATNAANLRSVKAEVVTALLTGDNSKYTITIPTTDTAATIGTPDSCPKAKKTTDPACAEGATMVITVDKNRNVTVTYGTGLDINAFANKAAS